MYFQKPYGQLSRFCLTSHLSRILVYINREPQQCNRGVLGVITRYSSSAKLIGEFIFNQGLDGVKLQPVSPPSIHKPMAGVCYNYHNFSNYFHFVTNYRLA